MDVVKITTKDGILFTSGRIRTATQTTSTANTNDLVTFNYVDDANNTLTSSLSTTKSELSSALSTETSRAISTEGSLLSKITSDISLVINNAPAVLDTINEIAMALDNDASFAANVATNLATLSTNLSSEASRAISSESSLSSNLSSEISGVSTNLSSEASRAKSEEGKLTSNLNTLKSDVSNNYVKNTVLSTTLSDTVEDISGDVTDYVKTYTKVDTHPLLDHDLIGTTSFISISCGEKLSRTFSTSDISGITQSVFLSGINLSKPLAGGKYRILLTGYNGASIATSLAFAITFNNGDDYTPLTASNSDIYKNYGSNEKVVIDPTNANASSNLYLEIDYIGYVSGKHVLNVRLLPTEATLTSAISSETSRATSAETKLSSAISSETSRATSVDTNLSSAISRETSRATTVETSIASNILNIRGITYASATSTTTIANNLTLNSTFNLLPAGMIMATVLSTAPSGWLLCNGANVSRTTYAKLFAAIGITFGTGDGSTTFKLPDYRGAFLRGAGANPSNSANSATLNTSQTDGLKSHSHPITDPGHSHTYERQLSQSATGSNNARADNTTYTDNTSTSTTGITVNNNTGGIGETRPYNWAINYLIKT